MKKGKFFYFLLLIGWVYIYLFIFSGDVQASRFDINIEKDRLNLRAEKASLISVLKVIAEKADIYLETSNPLTRPISLDLKNVSIEEGIRRLLAKQNYTLTFKKIGENNFALTEIRILSPGNKEKAGPSVTPKMIARTNTPAEQAPPPSQSAEHSSPEPAESPFKKYEQDWFKQELENIERLSGEITIEKTFNEPSRPDVITYPGDTPHPPKPHFHNEGIKIKEIASTSIFSKIGLKKGDIIRDINGHVIKNKEELIRELQKATKDETPMRIERTNDMIPIYIELHSSDSPDPNEIPPEP